MSLDRRLESLSDDELLRRLEAIVQKSRRAESELIAHIAEVDHRRLFASQASPSMFSYCTEVLHFSEHEAYLRIAAARASRQHPVLLEMLADGRLHLSGIAKLAPHLTKDNSWKLLARATHKTKRQIEELVAELAPKPDVPPTVRKLPSPPPKAAPIYTAQLGPDRVTVLHTRSTEPTVPSPPPVQAAPPPPKVEPLAPTRYKVQFTASAEFHKKLKRLQALMRFSFPDGDLAAIIEVAVTDKLERLEAKRYAKTDSPRKSLEETDTSPDSRYIPAAVRRAVVERDRNQCTFVDPRGHRCSERHRLEFHHHDPFGRGGDHSAKNISLRCSTHNQYQAERDYGKRLMDRYRRLNDRVREPAPEYSSSCSIPVAC